jgi:hypothetical protein
MKAAVSRLKSFLWAGTSAAWTTCAAAWVPPASLRFRAPGGRTLRMVCARRPIVGPSA